MKNKAYNLQNFSSFAAMLKILHPQCIALGVIVIIVFTRISVDPDSAPAVISIKCYIWEKNVYKHRSQISAATSNNSVLNTILFRVQLSNKRRPQISAALECEKFNKRRGTYSGKYGVLPYEPHFTETRLIRTPLCYGQFCLLL